MVEAMVTVPQTPTAPLSKVALQTDALKALSAYKQAKASSEAYYVYVLRTTNAEKIATSKAALEKHNIQTIPLSVLLPYALEVVEETNPTIKDNAAQKLAQVRKELSTYSLGSRTFSLLIQAGAIKLKERFQHTQALMEHVEERYTPCKTAEDMINALFADDLLDIVTPDEVGKIMNATVVYGVDDTELGLGFLEASNDLVDVNYASITIEKLVKREKNKYKNPQDRVLAIALRSTAIQILQTKRAEQNNGQLNLKEFSEKEIKKQIEKVLKLPAPGPEAADYYKAVGTEIFIRRFYDLLTEEELCEINAISKSFIYNIQQDWNIKNENLEKTGFSKKRYYDNREVKRKKIAWIGSLSKKIEQIPFISSISDVLIPKGSSLTSSNILADFLSGKTDQIDNVSSRGDKLIALFNEIIDKSYKKPIFIGANQEEIVVAVVDYEQTSQLQLSSSHKTQIYHYGNLIDCTQTTAMGNEENPVWQDPRFAKIDNLVADHGLYVLNAPPQGHENYKDFLNTALTLLINIQIRGTNQQLLVVGDPQTQNHLRNKLKEMAAAGYSNDPEYHSCHFIEENQIDAKLSLLIASSSSRLGGDMLVAPHALSLPVDLVKPQPQVEPIQSNSPPPSKPTASFSCLPVQLIGSASYINHLDLEAAELFLKTFVTTLVNDHGIIPILYEGGGYTSHMANFSNCQVTFANDGVTYVVPHQACTESQIAHAEHGTKFQGLYGAMVNGLAARTREVLGKPGVLLEFPGGIGSLVEELGKHSDTVAARINMGGVSVYDEEPGIFVDLSKTKTDRNSIIQDAKKLAEKVATDQSCQNNIVRHTLSELRDQWGAVAVHQTKQSRRQNLVALLGDLVTKAQLLTHSLAQLAR
jgi:hypothetical protein